MAKSSKATTAKATTAKATTAKATTAKATTKTAKTSGSKSTTAKKTTTKESNKKTTTAKTTTAVTTAGKSNTEVQKIDAWATKLHENISKFANQLDTTEDIVQQMAGKVRGTSDLTLYQALIDLRALMDNAHVKLKEFNGSFWTQMKKYSSTLTSANQSLSDKLKNQDQFRENASKISKLKMD